MQTNQRKDEKRQTKVRPSCVFDNQNRSTYEYNWRSFLGIFNSSITIFFNLQCNRCKNNRKTNDRAHTTVVLSDLVTPSVMLDCLQFVYTGTIETKSNLQVKSVRQDEPNSFRLFMNNGRFNFSAGFNGDSGLDGTERFTTIY